MTAVLGLWVLIILFGVREKKNNGQPLIMAQSVALRGICAVEIMIGHLGGSTGSEILWPNRKAGILFVGIFFMLSGYGVAYSVQHKENYLRCFVGKKIIKLMIPAYLVYFICETINILYWQNRGWEMLINFKYFFASLNWYVWEQLALYIVYYCVYRLITNKAELAIGVVSVIFIAVAFAFRVNNPWYGSTLCFTLGLSYYKYEEEIQRLIADKFWIIILGFGSILVVATMAFLFWGNESILGNPVARNAASLSFCIVTLALLSRVEIGNSVSRCLGKCSYEIYLVHPFVLSFLSGIKLNSNIIFCWLTIGSSVLLAVIIHNITVMKIRSKVQ